MAKEERYPTVNGKDYAERIADGFRAEGASVTVERGPIPQWGSGIPGSPTYGKTEQGYTVVVKRGK